MLETCIQTSGIYTRVHEGGHAEVGQDKEEDQAIVERHGGRDHLRQPGAPRDTEEGAEVKARLIIRDMNTESELEQAPWLNGATNRDERDANGAEVASQSFCDTVKPEGRITNEADSNHFKSLGADSVGGNVTEKA
ncbi:hypothetical protein EYF80_013460 [Liparis tanakae]|uniref:Uncharacterized protein n=1 Tax=Liparis tanakae TaxID=230148 RepID=A0A4Z2IF33_9TELE|nr:hypothetical protein EYF80_013460 [Liparis tanakae]